MPDSPLSVRLGIPLVALSLLPCASALAQDGSVELDLPYVTGGGHKQQLDFHTPLVPAFPTILYVHGGSLTSGDRKDEPTARMCETFQQAGIGCAAMSYRLADDAPWPAQPRDVASAFAWLKVNLGERGGDPDRVFLFGHSSGCLLAALVGADPTYLAEQDLSQADVAGLVPLGCTLNPVLVVSDTPPEAYETYRIPPDRVGEYPGREPPYQTLDQRRAAVPARHVTADLPPTLVLLAEQERFFPPVLRDGAEFVGRALAAGAEADLMILADRTHRSAIERMTSPDDPVVQAIVSFVQSH